MNWKDKHNLFFKLLRLHFGLALYSIGLTLGIQANIGLAPWEAFGIGVSYVTGLTYGTINVLSGLLILVVTVAMGERFGLGTILNAVLIGFGVDVLQYYHAVPLIENYWLGIIVMFLGQFSISLGTYFYISAGLGSGPRDSLMIGLKRRLPKVPIGMIRGLIEGSVLLAGWLLGAKVGLGTIIAAFGISTILQLTFNWLGLYDQPETRRAARRRSSLSFSAGSSVAGGSGIGSGSKAPMHAMQQAPSMPGMSSAIGNSAEMTLLKSYDYDESSFRHHQPLSFALTFRKEFAYGLSLESGINYTLLQSDVRALYADKETDQTLHFVGIPVRVNWQFLERGRFSLYLGAGGMAEKCVSAKFGSKSVSEPGLQWSLIGAAGAQYRLGGMVGLYFEPEAAYYLTETRLQTARTDNPLSLTLRLGVRLSF